MGGNVREARAECLDEIVVFIGEALLVCVVLDGASGHEALHETTQVHVEPHAHTSANHVSGELLEPLCGTLDFAEELVGVKDCDGLDHVPEGHVLDEILVERAQAVSVEQACEGAVYLGRSFAGDEFLERNERDSIGVRIVRADDRAHVVLGEGGILRSVIGELPPVNGDKPRGGLARQALRHEIADPRSCVKSAFGAEDNRVRSGVARHDVIITGASCRSIVENLSHGATRDKSGANLHRKAGRGVVDDAERHAGGGFHTLINILERSHVHEDDDLVCVGEAVDDLLKRNSDVRNLLVVGHVDGLEDPRVKNPIGGVGDARGGRVAMTEDDTDAPTTLRRVECECRMRKDEQTREIVECDAERGLEFISDAGADSNGKAVALGHDAAHAGKLACMGALPTREACGRPQLEADALGD